MTANNCLAALYDCLISEYPIVVQDPLYWSNDDIIRQLILIRKCLTKDALKQSLLLEARRVFYQRNAFIVSMDWLPLFLEDILGDWEDLSVEELVLDLTLQANGDDIYHGPARGLTQHQPGLTKQLSLSKTPSELYWGTTAITDDPARHLCDLSDPSTIDSPLFGSVGSDEAWDTVTLASEVGEDVSWDLSEDIQG
ncbi:hypothetical protein ACHAO7_009395 [Fusarium culmorum]